MDAPLSLIVHGMDILNPRPTVRTCLMDRSVAQIKTRGQMSHSSLSGVRKSNRRKGIAVVDSLLPEAS